MSQNRTNLFNTNPGNTQQNTGMFGFNNPATPNNNLNIVQNQNQQKSLISQSMMIDINKRINDKNNSYSNPYMQGINRQRIKTNEKNQIDPKYRSIANPIFGSAQFGFVHQQGDQKIKDLDNQRKDRVIKLNSLIENQNKKVETLIGKSSDIQQQIKNQLQPQLSLIQQKILQQNSLLIGLKVKHEDLFKDFDELKNILKSQSIYIKSIQQKFHKEEESPTKNFKKLQIFVNKKIQITKKILHEIFSLLNENNYESIQNADAQFQWANVEQTIFVLVKMIQNLKNEACMIREKYITVRGKRKMESSYKNDGYVDLYDRVIKVDQSDNQINQQRTLQINKYEAGNSQ